MTLPKTDNQFDPIEHKFEVETKELLSSLPVAGLNLPKQVAETELNAKALYNPANRCLEIYLPTGGVLWADIENVRGDKAPFTEEALMS